MKTLKNFLKKHNACSDGFDFAKDLTLEQFLNACERGDWILWLFARTNPESKQEVILAAGHCVNTVRHLMKDKRSLAAVDAAIAFGEGRATREELDGAAYDACVAACDVNHPTTTAAHNAAAAAAARAVVADAAAAALAAAFADGDKNQKLTADICRKYLPLEIWNQSEI